MVLTKWRFNVACSSIEEHRKLQKTHSSPTDAENNFSAAHPALYSGGSHPQYNPLRTLLRT